MGTRRRPNRAARRLSPILLGLVLAAPVSAGNNYAAERNAVTLDHAQSQFVLRCGGCHGTLGVSPPESVPILRGIAGHFLCTPEARAYMVRLPNVSRAQLTSSELADVLNFVAFRLGENSAPPGAKPFTREEVEAIRAKPLDEIPLLAYRRKVVEKLVSQCAAPKVMLEYGRKRQG